MSFGKSLFIAVSATGTSLTAVAVAGFLTNTGPLALGPDGQQSAAPPPLEPSTIVMEPVPLDPRGYSLRGLEQDDLIYVSVEILVRTKPDRLLVCRLMPRLTATILRDLGPRLWSQPTFNNLDEAGTNLFVRDRFDQALGAKVVAEATVRFVEDRRAAPKPNCSETLHHGWQSWMRRAQRDLRETER
ncbi:MAG: hypothetical protein RIE87_15145 [Rhodospirillales bacterium]